MDLKPLTQYAKASGCGCKIQPAILSEILQGFTVSSADFPQLKVGNHSGDDCSVWDLGNGNYLLQTVDFFTPLVNDAYTFGKAAATNALSDIWAMGGKPIMANAVMGWPVDVLPIALAREVLRGAKDACFQAGVALAGGHSIDSPEPMFGLSVTGLVQDNFLKTNAGAASGDILVLTKPLGIGMLSAAHKRMLSNKEQDSALFHWITKPNSVGADVAQIEGVHAITDVTGFGFLGHLLELCDASQLAAEVEFANLPLIPEAVSLAAQFVLPDNAMRNWNAYQNEIELNDQAAFPWIVDPQSSGGLLIAMDPSCLDAVNAIMLQTGNAVCNIIGKLGPKTEGNKRIVVK